MSWRLCHFWNENGDDFLLDASVIVVVIRWWDDGVGEDDDDVEDNDRKGDVGEDDDYVFGSHALKFSVRVEAASSCTHISSIWHSQVRLQTWSRNRTEYIRWNDLTLVH